MIKTQVIFLFFSTLFLWSNLDAKDIDNITILTSNNPPKNMKINGKLEGKSVEVLLAMFKVMGSKLGRKDIKLLPWARAKKTLNKQKNTMLFSMNRTKKREKKYKWVGPIGKSTMELITLKDNNYQIKNIQELNKYKITVTKKSSRETFLLSHGVKHEHILSRGGNNPKLSSLRIVKKKRADFLIEDVSVVKYIAGRHDIDFSKYRVVKTLKSWDSYFSFNINTSDKIISQYQNALDTIKKNGVFAKIMLKDYNAK